MAEYQNRLKEDKSHETARRTKNLKESPVDITPPNKGKFLWSDAKNLDQFEQDFSFKPVTVKGIFDHQKEFQVAKEYRGERGVQIITPFYTHLDANGKENAILVNRGWVPHDLKDLRMHTAGKVAGKISGVLYRGDVQHNYSTPNSPTV